MQFAFDAVQVQAVLSPQRGAIIFDRQFDPFILAAVSEIDKKKKYSQK